MHLRQGDSHPLFLPTAPNTQSSVRVTALSLPATPLALDLLGRLDFSCYFIQLIAIWRGQVLNVHINSSKSHLLKENLFSVNYWTFDQIFTWALKKKTKWINKFERTKWFRFSLRSDTWSTYKGPWSGEFKYTSFQRQDCPLLYNPITAFDEGFLNNLKEVHCTQQTRMYVRTPVTLR